LNKLIIFFTGLIIFFVSLYLLGNYTEGDYIDYTNAYEAIYGKSYLPALFSYTGLIGSSEPIHFTISWIASNLGLSRIYFISSVNALLVIAFLILGKKINSSLFVLVIIALSNLYFFALFTELERLKFAFFFFFIAIYFLENKKLFYFFSILTVLSHLQFLVIYGGFLLVYSLKQLKNIVINYRIEIKVFFIFLVAFIILFAMSDQLIAKLSYYYKELNYLHLLKASPFILLIMFYAKDKTESLVFITPLFVMILLVGGNRLNIFAYFIFLFHALQKDKGINLAILVTTLYYFSTSIIFIYNIFEYGRGYGM
jgi:hypothetical protein